MKKKSLLATFCSVCLCAVAITFVASATYEFVDGVVATVGREPILHSDVMHEIMPMLHELGGHAGTQEERARRVEELFKDALEQTIEYHILHREAETLGVEIPEDEVERRLAEMRKHYDSSEAFQEALKEAGHTVSAFRERLRRQMMAISVGMSRRRQFEREAVISESDIAQFYHDNVDEFRYSARYRVRRLFVQASNDPEERASVLASMQELREALVSGGDFAEAARERSDGPEAAEGGMIGWVLPGDLVEPLDSALASLSEGEISGVLETDYGVHLLKLEEVESEGVLSYEEARNQIEPILREQQGDERYRQWMNTLRRRSNVRVFL